MQAALLKPSKFNSFIKNEKNETIMYNSLTGNLVKFSENMENMIQEIFSKDIINRSDIKNEELITKGFLIPSFPMRISCSILCIRILFLSQC